MLNLGKTLSHVSLSLSLESALVGGMSTSLSWRSGAPYLLTVTLFPLLLYHDGLSSSQSLPSLLMEAALSAAVADGVIPSFNDDGNKKADGGGVESKDGTGVDIMTAQRQPTVLEISSAPKIQPASDYNLGMEMMNQFLGNGVVKVDPTSLMAAAAAQSQVTVEAEPSAIPVLRRGKWTCEEEAYANRLIQEFKAGLLPLTDGTTLRTFLSKLLNCDPMRISKKFVGSNCIGKQVFRRRSADVNNLNPDEIEQTRFELSELERKFLDRVAQSKSSRGGGSGGASKKVSGEMMSSSRGGGGPGNKMNKSAAAAGRALLLGNNAPHANTSQENTAIDGAGGLLAQLRAENPGMFDNNTAGSFLGVVSQTGGLGKKMCFHLVFAYGVFRHATAHASLRRPFQYFHSSSKHELKSIHR